MQLNVSEELTHLYSIHGVGLFELVGQTFERMAHDEQGRFFCDDLCYTVELVYEPTTRADSCLPLPVWDYFRSGYSQRKGDRRPEKTPGAPGMFVEMEFGDDAEEDELDFTRDMGELLLVLTGKVSL